MYMKPNSYIYPYVAFNDLSNKDIKNNLIERKEISLSQLKELIFDIKKPQPTIKGENLLERILSLFLDEEILFGPRDHIETNKKYWQERLSYFIAKNEPIQFTLLGLPFKIPVPLKTNRVLPDMGEVLFLLRLNSISELISNEYKPGAKITILAEDLFADFVGISESEAEQYYLAVKELNEKLGFSKNIEIISFKIIHDHVDNFPHIYEEKIFEHEKLYQNNDKDFLTKYNNTYDILKKIVTSKKYDNELLMDVYNDNLSNEQISDEVLKIRDELDKKAHQAVLKYFALLKLRDEVDLLEKLVPCSLSLSVAPKLNRLGIIPINKDSNRLPYHAVPVYDNGKFTLEYLIDIKRDAGKYLSIYFHEDKENKPFYYEKK